MSCNYAEGLSPYDNKGVLGVPERFDNSEIVETKCNTLTEWILKSNHVVMHTGAGISTSAGIPDFRGPNGVWTLESKGLKPSINISFDNAKPTYTHMAIKKLLETGHVRYIITQNIDGLHLRTGVSRDNIAELHGNMFTERCSTCERQFIRKSATTSVGEKCLDTPCPGTRTTGRPCRGKLHDTILDWEANLPEKDLDMAEYHSNIADLNICLGTTLQIVPSGNLPLHTKKYNGKLVIINLQPTKHDKKADLIINTFVDEVMKRVMKKLGLEIPEYSIEIDPTKSGDAVIDWTISNRIVKEYKLLYNERLKMSVKKRKLNKKTNNKPIKNDIKNEVKTEITEMIKNEIKTEMCDYNKSPDEFQIKNEAFNSNISNEESQNLCENNMISLINRLDNPPNEELPISVKEET